MTTKINAAKFAKSVDGAFDKMLNAKNLFAGWANRELMDQYSDMQLRRWRSQNAQNGDRWTPLNERYAKRKRTQFAQYPGAGRRMMIGTGRLLAGIIPPDQRSALSVRGPYEEFRKVVGRDSIKLSTTVPYAKYVDKEREFTSITEETKHQWAKSYLKYLIKGVKK